MTVGEPFQICGDGRRGRRIERRGRQTAEEEPNHVGAKSAGDFDLPIDRPHGVLDDRRAVKEVAPAAGHDPYMLTVPRGGVRDSFDRFAELDEMMKIEVEVDHAETGENIQHRRKRFGLVRRRRGEDAVHQTGGKARAF